MDKNISVAAGAPPLVAGHTPGPWRAVSPKGRPAEYTSIIEGADGRMVLFAGAPFRSDDEIVGNAALAAAAIDLMDGCNALLGLIQFVCSRDDMPSAIRAALQTSHRVEEARAAITKAEGH